MESKEFALGVADVRAGRDYHPDYEIWAKDNRSWNYERGRHWACVAPRNLALKRNGSVTAEAKKWWPHEVVHAPLRQPISNDIVGKPLSSQVPPIWSENYTWAQHTLRLLVQTEVAMEDNPYIMIWNIASTTFSLKVTGGDFMIRTTLFHPKSETALTRDPHMGTSYSPNSTLISIVVQTAQMKNLIAQQY